MIESVEEDRKDSWKELELRLDLFAVVAAFFSRHTLKSQLWKSVT